MAKLATSQDLHRNKSVTVIGGARQLTVSVFIDSIIDTTKQSFGMLKYTTKETS